MGGTDLFSEDFRWFLDISSYVLHCSGSRLLRILSRSSFNTGRPRSYSSVHLQTQLRTIAVSNGSICATLRLESCLCTRPVMSCTLHVRVRCTVQLHPNNRAERTSWLRLSFYPPPPPPGCLHWLLS